MTIGGTASINRGQTITTGAKRYALTLLVIVYTFNFIDRYILAILLPAIKAEFAVDDRILGFLAGSAFALFYATLGIPIALIADRSNRRNLIALALVIWSGMTALSGIATNIMHLILTRIGVGIGEAGCSPPAHSMIADYFPPEQRSTAMGIYTLGISFGIMIAYLAGGWVVENIGWREAFFIVGIPGLILALFVRFTIIEPQRGISENITDTGDRPSIITVTRFLAGRKSFLHMSIGAGLASFLGYAIISFYPSFLVRSFSMSLSDIGIYLGLILGIAGGFGYAGGGYIADKIGQRKIRYLFQSIVAAMLLVWILYFPIFLSNNEKWSLSFFAILIIFSNVYLPTTFAQTQSLVPLRMRAVASALILFIINSIGLGFGPLLTGILSDYLATLYSNESMRYSLLIIGAVIGPWAAFHYFIASKYIEHDLARVYEA